MRLILCIDTPGYFIDIPGIPSFRTPTKIDVTIPGLNLIISELKKLGIESYTLESISKNNDVKVIEKEKVDKIIKENDMDTIYKRFDEIEKIISEKPSKKLDIDISKRFNIIEELLNSIVKSQPVETKIKKEKEHDFIPSVDLDDIEISGRETFKTKKATRNVIENSENLAKLIKK